MCIFICLDLLGVDFGYNTICGAHTYKKSNKVNMKEKKIKRNKVNRNVSGHNIFFLNKRENQMNKIKMKIIVKTNKHRKKYTKYYEILK